MSVTRLKETDFIDPEKEVHLAFHTGLSSTTLPHCHEFYEIFLICEGSIVHNINGTRLLLHENALVLIRPDDIHFYEKIKNSECRFINLAFSQKSVKAMLHYLGEENFDGRFYEAAVPPFVSLTNTEKNIIKMRIEELNTTPIFQKSFIKVKFRALLAELFTRYFYEGYSFEKTATPGWLEQLCRNAENSEIFVKGLPELIRVSNVSHEHLCRIFKIYLKKTPTEYINEHRLNYAANLLINTDKDILAVCMDVGFGNLSHFCHTFKRRFQVSPGNFRRINKKSVIHINDNL